LSLVKTEFFPLHQSILDDLRLYQSLYFSFALLRCGCLDGEHF